MILDLCWSRIAFYFNGLSPKKAPTKRGNPAPRAQRTAGEDRPIKYLAIAVLLAIVAGAIIYHVNHPGNLPPAESSSGWMQR